jgi:16S rRNA (adenine1518-N6/adenine1519-N6)-dimethyltransferase
MSLEETKGLLRNNRIVPNKILGQNFMVDFSIYPKLSNYASLKSHDIVLDAGAGFGFLTRFLSNRCKSVVAVEKDPQVAKVLREQVGCLTNVTVVEGDVLKVPLPVFNKVISIPPYYLSSKLILWLLDRGLDSAVLIVQKEFADRLVASVNSEEYGWLYVVTYQSAQVELLDAVPAGMFYPPPEVDSVIVRLKPWTTPPFSIKDASFFKRLTKWLFTQRNKKLGNALVPFIKSELGLDKAKAGDVASKFSQQNSRVRELTPKDFGDISNVLSR